MLLSAVLTLVAAGSVAASAPAGAVTGYVTTASPYLNARGGPGTGYGAVGTLGYHAGLDISCQVQGGTNVGGNATWDRLTNGWWIADYWTTTPSFNSYIPGVPDCNAAPAPTPTPAPTYQRFAAAVANTPLRSSITGAVIQYIGVGTPTDVACQIQNGPSVGGNRTWDRLTGGQWVADYYLTTPSFNSYIPGIPDCGAGSTPVLAAREAAAVSRATSMLGQQYQSNGNRWDGWCDRFVAVTFGRSSSGYNTAFVHYTGLVNRGVMHAGDRNPPPGALVFFGPTAKNGNAGHVMLAAGNGQFISTTFSGYAGSRPGRVSTVSLSWGETYSGPYLGWSYAVNW